MYAPSSTSVSPVAMSRDMDSQGMGASNTRPWSLAVIAVGIVVGVSILGLSHDILYLGAEGVQTVEAGEGIAEQDKFDADVGAALVQRKIGFAVMPLLVLWCFWTAPANVSLRWNALALLMASLLAWCTASLFWSEMPRETIRELIRLWVFAATCFALARRFNIAELSIILFIGTAMSVGLAFGVELATGHFRPWLRDYRLAGTIHANVLARHAMFLALVALVWLLSGKRSLAHWAILLVACAVVYLTKSRATLIGVICGMGAIYALTLSLKSWVTNIAFCTTLLSGVVLLASLSGGWVERKWEKAVNLGRQQEGADVSSFVGRIPLWEKVWKDSSSRRGIGTGYGAYWTTNKTVEIGREINWFPRHAHNSYLELLADVGLVGMFLGIGIAILALVRSASLLSETGFDEYRLAAGFIVAGMVNGLAEAAYTQPRDLGLIVGSLLCSLVLPHVSTANALATTPEMRTPPLEAGGRLSGMSFPQHSRSIK